MKIVKLSLLLAPFLALLASCKEDTVCLIEPESFNDPKIHRMYLPESGKGSFYKLFHYDPQGRLCGIDLEDRRSEYIYNSNNLVQEYKISYFNGTPLHSGSIYYVPGSRYIDYTIELTENCESIKDSSVFEYRNDSIVKITHYTYTDLDQEYVLSGTNEYAYDLQGNVLKETRTYDEKTETLVYTYDDKNCPWKFVIPVSYDPLLGVISPHNITSQNYTLSDDQADQNESFTAVYAYNNKNFPVTAEFSSEGRGIYLLEYK